MTCGSPAAQQGKSAKCSQISLKKEALVHLAEKKIGAKGVS
jgi:hypothetical protein